MLLSVGTGLVFVGLWELLPALGVVDPFFVSSPSRIFKAGHWLFAHGFWYDIWVSLVEFTLGMILAIVFGVVTGFLIGWYRSLNAMFEPFITILKCNTAHRVIAVDHSLAWNWHAIQGGCRILGCVFPDCNHGDERGAQYRRDAIALCTFVWCVRPSGHSYAGSTVQCSIPGGRIAYWSWARTGGYGDWRAFSRPGRGGIYDVAISIPVPDRQSLCRLAAFGWLWLFFNSIA